MSKLIQAIEEMGWEFYQDSPNGGKWMLFDENGDRIAVQGDEKWLLDYGRLTDDQ